MALLEGLDDVCELRREDEVLVVLLAEEEEEHESLELLAVLLPHLAHHVREGLVLRSDGLVLLYQYLHHVLQLLVLPPQHAQFFLQPLLPPRNRHHLPLALLCCRLPLYQQQALTA